MVARLILASAVGALLSAVLASALVIAGLKAGITPGVSPLLVLVGWMVLAPWKSSDRGEFLLILQVAGSAGAAVTAGVIFTAPVLQLVAAEGLTPPVQMIPLLSASLAGALLGWACVGLSVERMLDDDRLPAPEAVACERLLGASVSAGKATNAASRDAGTAQPSLVQSLVLPGLIAGGTSVLLFLGRLRESVFQASLFGVQLPLPLSPLYLGIGAILSLETALLLFLGGLGNSIVKAVSVSFQLPNETFRWVGAAAMTVSICYSLVRYVSEQWRARTEQTTRSELSPRQSKIFLGVALLGVILGLRPAAELLFAASSNLSAGWSLAVLCVLTVALAVLAALLSAIGALLSLQVGSSASPVSGTVFVGMLVLTLLLSVLLPAPPLELVVYLLVTLCVAICAANDSSQDYKTIRLRGYSHTIGFYPQLAGLLAGVAVVPATLWLADQAFVLGSDQLPAPQASFFSVVLMVLLQGEVLPVGPIACGVALGVLVVGLEILGRRHGLMLSSISFCVGLYLPPSIGVGILLGSVCRALGGRRAANELPYSGVLTAASFISADAAVSLGFAFAIVGGLWQEQSEVANLGVGWEFAVLGGLLSLLVISFRRSERGRTDSKDRTAEL